MKSTKTIIFSLAISIIFIIIMLLLPKSVFAVKGSVTVDGVRVRKEPSTTSEILTDVYKTDTIEVLEKTGDWYKVKFGEYTGYMSAQFVTVTGDVPTANEVNNTVDSNTTSANTPEDNNTDGDSTDTNDAIDTIENENKITEADVYMLPVFYSNKIDTITLASNGTVIKTLNNWVCVKYGDKEGWVIKSKFENLAQVEVATQEQAEETPAVTEKKAYINVSSAIIRGTPSLEGEMVTALARNTEITIVEETGDWYKIKTDETQGYVAKRLVSDQKAETTSRSLQEARAQVVTKYYVSVSSANVRTEASTSSSKAGSLSKKAEVESVGEENGFYKIKYNDGYGYISKDLVVDSLDKIIVTENTTSAANSSTPSNVNPPSSSSGQGIVDFAMQFIGCRYVYAGASPSGFDCSGFVYYVLNQCGISVGRTISAQMAKGTAVGRDNLEVGDIIVFNDSANSSIGHTGIYIGGGRMVHAANPSRGVTTDTVTSGYYAIRYVTARRF